MAEGLRQEEEEQLMVEMQEEEARKEAERLHQVQYQELGLHECRGGGRGGGGDKAN